MSEYTEIAPIFASSHMRISFRGKLLFFSNIITYDYKDLKKNAFWKSYSDFLNKPANYEKEIALFWNNLQYYLDEELNEINGISVSLDIHHCSIGFRDQSHPFVQWVIEFSGPAHLGINKYENYLEEEFLEYPIYSLYFVDEPLQIREIKTTLNYHIDPTNRFVEYSADKGHKIGPYECLSVFIPEN